MLPEPPPDTRMAELDAILDLVASSNPPSGAATPPRRPPRSADRITRNMTAEANARRSSKEKESERMAIVEGARERQLIREAERYAELAYLRAKGAA
jgi:regulator of protease activity HflC (stomatin/prohibitin superfamily)